MTAIRAEPTVLRRTSASAARASILVIARRAAADGERNHANTGGHETPVRAFSSKDRPLPDSVGLNI
jgi:hypothetical protein